MTRIPFLTGTTWSRYLAPRTTFCVRQNWIVEFAKGLDSLGYELVSTGGRKCEAGLDVIGVSDVTGHPEIFDGEVKSLILQFTALCYVDWRRKDAQELKDLGYPMIEIVAVTVSI